MIPGQEAAVYSVTSLTRELKNLVEGKYRFIRVQGEISNLKIPFSGHAYFTLKDDGAQLKGVLFKGQSRYLEKSIKDGQHVICHGRISIYEPRGDYQIIVDSVDFQGTGLLQQRFLKLKKQLEAEGLFDQGRKQEINSFPKEIVLITSPSGAAVHDFLNIWRKRSFPAHITILPVRVQGDSAATEIAEAIATTRRILPETDIIVLCRGGGSLEDLWAFNEEIVARAIGRSTIPIVSAIGHDVDFSISDFCADLRAPTPTAAAEIIFPDGHEIKRQISRLQTALTNAIYNTIDSNQYRVDQNRRLLGDMNFLFTNSSLRLDHVTLKLYSVMEKRITNSTTSCNELSARLHSHSPVAKVQMQEQRLKFATEKLRYLFQKSFTDKEVLLGQQAALLDTVSPLRTMNRGYSITSKINPVNGKKTVIRESRQLTQEDMVEIRLYKGTVFCEVISTEEDLEK
ncbi:exodeoxyribonuclease VII large subunit [Desulfocapsa sp. AH-315-G09]|nr:exodeoxyribonuclease VII large subunit [Desulfocapsa sp.]MBN4048566.1 exodeoxyribonuclease VII large subunit [bacterium AH-315-N22]MBN4058715.1 exodeoxyribonuclease VII large subunit [Desulfocapsa sp. AH-315-J15]MBN4065188.1 exodeoxyribonuclease VII large subunit [Desulfocapsa sp. AH-315-G09]